MIVVICIISILPWIGIGDFCFSGESGEAAIASSILETGNWILPRGYAGEIVSNPPFANWLIALASYPEGRVTEFTSGIPSAVAFTVMIGFILVFFGKRFKFQEAFIATLLLITSLGIHEVVMTKPVDTILTMFLIIGLIQLYRWEEKLELKGLPVTIPILLGCAILTGGAVGLILPLLIFGVYLVMLRKYRVLTIFKSLLYVFVSSLFLPALWYVAAWRESGQGFSDWTRMYNFGFFPRLTAGGTGMHSGFIYNLLSILNGFMPWTLFFIFSLFGTKILIPGKSFKAILKSIANSILTLHTPQLFGLVVIACVLLYYSFPVGNGPVYLLVAYPFIALFLGKYTLYITEYRTKVTRIFASFMLTITVLILLVILLTASGAFHPVKLLAQITQNAYTLAQIDSVVEGWRNLSALTVFILFVIFTALCTVFYQMRKKINIKILYATIGLVFTLNLLHDGVLVKSLRESYSCRIFAEQIKRDYPLNRSNVYVMNDMRQYPHFYGLNFYLGNIFRNFAKEKPSEGFFIATEEMMPRIENEFKEYTFIPLASNSPGQNGGLARKIVLIQFIKK